MSVRQTLLPTDGLQCSTTLIRNLCKLLPELNILNPPDFSISENFFNYSENLHFQVFGPKELLPDGEPLTSLRPGLVGEPEMKRYPWGKRFDRFEDAQAAFEKIISHFAKNQ